MIGKKIKRVDGKSKVNGSALYGQDESNVNMLYAACKYPDIACGNILAIDFTGIEEVDEDIHLITILDVPGKKRIGPIRKDQYPIVDKSIFYEGDVIAVVAADTPEMAREAVDKIKVEYIEKEGVFNVKDAFDRRQIVHEEYPDNIVVHYPLRKGNVKDAFEVSDFVIEREFDTGFHEHAYIEPESVTVIPDFHTNGFVVKGSIQNPFTTRKAVAEYLGINMNKVNVIPSVMGGSFGGKDDTVNMMACRAALMSLKTGRPVQLTLNREESLKESYKRHPYNMVYKAGFNQDGKINALKILILADSGAYSSQTFFVTWRSVVQATGPYSIPNVETDVYGVYTNNVYTGAYRGFGTPQVIFAQESLMNEIAEICNISPVEIRWINGFKQNSITASGQKLEDHRVSLIQVMNKALKESDYESQVEILKQQNTDRYKHGIGFAVSYRGCSLGAEGVDATSAMVSIQADGSVILTTALHENGQGLRTTFSMIVAEQFGIDIKDIVFINPSTSHIGDGGPTVASRSTLLGGQAIINACTKLKKRLVGVIDCNSEQVDSEYEWKNGSIVCKNNNKKQFSFLDTVQSAIGKGISLSEYGWYKGPDATWNEETGQGNAYFTYVYGCHVAKITVDVLTGKIDVNKITAVHDVGKVINLLGAEGQVYGGVLQGMGYGVLEEYQQTKGRTRTANFDEYLIPTIKDMPEIDAFFVENPDPFGPYGAKSLGEPTLELTAAAINNAFANATHKHNYRLPLSLEQVLLGYNPVKPARSSETQSCKTSSIKIDSCMNVIVPQNLEEALKMKKESGFDLYAGGTDKVIEISKGKKTEGLIYIANLDKLKGVTKNDNLIRIAACSTFTEILSNLYVREYLPLLTKACALIGSTQVRNTATIGGNICNAASCADSVPPLLAYEAELELQSTEGTRVVKLSDFITGSYKTIINDNEILTAVLVPSDKGKLVSYYEQLGRRNAVNITRMSLSILTDIKEGKINDIAISAGSLIYKPARLSFLEEFLEGKAFSEDLINDSVEILNEELNKQIGKRWSAKYKIPVFKSMFRHALKKLWREEK